MDIGLSFCYLFRVARIRSRMIVQVDTIGIMPQVVRCEVEPEVGGRYSAIETCYLRYL